MCSRLLLAIILVALGFSVSSGENQTNLQNPSIGNRISGTPEQINPSTINNNSQQGERGTEKNPIFVKGIPATKTQQEEAEDREERNKKTLLDLDLNSSTKLQAIFTVVLAVVAIFQIILFWYQLSLMKDTLEVSKASADAALEQAKAITQSERAYVFAKVIIEQRSDDVDMILKYRTVFKNHGKTPANIISLDSDGYAIIRPNDIKNIARHETTWVYPDGLVIAGGASWSGTKPVLINQGVAELTEGQKGFYCFGFIRYRDVFGNHWETGYCWEYIAGQNRFRLCEQATHLNYYRPYKPENTTSPAGV